MGDSFTVPPKSSVNRRWPWDDPNHFVHHASEATPTCCCPGCHYNAARFSLHYFFSVSLVGVRCDSCHFLFGIDQEGNVVSKQKIG